MAKTEQELEEIKGKIEELERELSGLSEEELEKVTGGSNYYLHYKNGLKGGNMTNAEISGVSSAPDSLQRIYELQISKQGK